MASTKKEDGDDAEVKITEGAGVEAPTAKQLKIDGFKPKAIEELDSRFEDVIKARNSLTAIRAKLQDAKLNLKTAMQKHKVPAYGYTRGEDAYVATVTEKSEITVKTTKPDRE